MGVEWWSFLMGVMLGSVIMSGVAAIAVNVSDVREILRELACCEALRRREGGDHG